MNFFKIFILSFHQLILTFEQSNWFKFFSVSLEADRSRDLQSKSIDEFCGEKMSEINYSIETVERAAWMTIPSDSSELIASLSCRKFGAHLECWSSWVVWYESFIKSLSRWIWWVESFIFQYSSFGSEQSEWRRCAKCRDRIPRLPRPPMTAFNRIPLWLKTKQKKAKENSFVGRLMTFLTSPKNKSNFKFGGETWHRHTGRIRSLWILN